MKRILGILLVFVLAGNLFAYSQIFGTSSYIINKDETLTFFLKNNSSFDKEYRLTYYCDVGLHLPNTIKVKANDISPIYIDVPYFPKNATYSCLLIAENSGEKISKTFVLEFKEKNSEPELKKESKTGFFYLGAFPNLLIDAVLFVIVVLLLLAFITRYINYKEGLK